VSRRFFGGEITDEARAGWDAWLTRQGITVAALLEAIGLQLGDDPRMDMPYEMQPPHVRVVIDRAKAVQAERKKRR
jgi:hypothetical protein